jgi:2-polyprenyl-3-methyl-5-hydroxy-6-metoxy-1,4-benzoquinol methylase
MASTLFSATLKTLKYASGVYPSVWQLPNAVKIHEFKELADGVHLAPGNRVLDLGCGKGIQSQLLARRGPSVLGVDPDEKKIRIARRELQKSRLRDRVEFVCGTLESLRLPAGSFSHVFSFCVLEHIANLHEVMLELHRLLEPGGELHATVDALSNIDDPELLERHREKYSVHRYFRPESVREAFRAAGFDLFSQQYILSSRYARRQLLQELETGQSLQPPGERRNQYLELVRQETGSIRDAGLMILCRARRI